MSRRLPTLLLALALLPACAPDEPPAPPPRPDVVLYLVDTLRQDHLGVYGYERDTTPHLDALGAECVVFRRAFAPSSWTKASTASLMTGRHPIHHGATSRTSRVADDVPILAQYLERLGYASLAVVTNPFVVGHWGFDRGYEEFLDLGEKAPGPQGWQHVGAEHVHRRAFRMLDERTADDRPLFLYLHTIDVHGPNNPKPPYDTRFTDAPKPPGQAGRLTPADPQRAKETIDLYDAEIAYMDDRLGEFVAELKDREIYDDALLWFVSDHGEEFLDHGRGGHGTQLFDETVVVPLMVRLPGGRLGGTVIDTPVSIIDVVPTVLAMLGEEPPEELEGRDLLPIAEGDATPRPFFFDLNLISGPEQTLHVSRGVFYERFKYVEESLPEPRRLFFDLATDPGEQRNLVDAPAARDKVRELETILRFHRASRRTGLVLSGVGDKDPAGRAMEVRLSTDGRFVGAELFDHEAGDVAEYEAGGATMTLRLDLRAYDNNVNKGALVQDIDSVHLTVEPPGAAVRVESVTGADGRAWPVFLGTARARADLPASLAADDEALLTDDMGLLFSEEERRPVAGEAPSVPPGLYVVSLRGLDAELDELPAEMHDRLKELGYVR